MNETCLIVYVERLPEGGYLATSEALQGLVAQGRTVAYSGNRLGCCRTTAGITAEKAAELCGSTSLNSFMT